MEDEVTYNDGGVLKNIFTDQPLPDTEAVSDVDILGPERVDTDMVFATKIEVPETCVDCLIVLKQTYHPNWRATIDGTPVETFTVFPFFTAINVEEFAGTHEVVFRYEPNTLKITLLVLSLLAAGILTAGMMKMRMQKR